MLGVVLFWGAKSADWTPEERGRLVVDEGIRLGLEIERGLHRFSAENAFDPPLHTYKKINTSEINRKKVGPI